MDALGVEGLELMDFFNNEVGVNVCNIERDFGILHPEGGGAGLL